jgi:hypothetical protein
MSSIPDIAEIEPQQVSPSAPEPHESVSVRQLVPVNSTYAELEDSRRLSQSELEIRHHQYAKSVKSDDAATPVHLWDNRVWKSPHDRAAVLHCHSRYGHCPLTTWRCFLLRRWRINLRKSLMYYLKVKHGDQWWSGCNPSQELLKDKLAGAESIWRAMAAT